MNIAGRIFIVVGMVWLLCFALEPVYRQWRSHASDWGEGWHINPVQFEGPVGPEVVNELMAKADDRINRALNSRMIVLAPTALILGGLLLMRLTRNGGTEDPAPPC